ncbi:protein-L-isoaspartate(D-aspartate) O-methyltransferase [Thermodesulfobacteriota bacterium]
MNNYDKARERMVREQLLTRNISDPKVLDALHMVPRHLFVEDALQGQAYGDFPLPIGEGQTISQPYIVALMTQALELKGEETVLEIGTGCGYQTAVLACICEKVFSVERIKPLLVKARRLLDSLQILNVVCKVDDGTLGWPENSPYDAIMVTAAGPDIPQPLIDQLKDPGRMVIPVGDRMSQQLIVVHKNGGQISTRTIEHVRFVSLIGNHGWQS